MLKLITLAEAGAAEAAPGVEAVATDPRPPHHVPRGPRGPRAPARPARAVRGGGHRAGIAQGRSFPASRGLLGLRYGATCGGEGASQRVEACFRDV